VVSINNKICPICKISGVDFHAVDSCPQCESDLVPFRLLDEYDPDNKNDIKADNKQAAIATPQAINTTTPISSRSLNANALNINNLVRICFIGMSVFMFFILMWQAIFLTYIAMEQLNPQPLTAQYNSEASMIKTLNERLELLENQVVKLYPPGKDHSKRNTSADLQDRTAVPIDSSPIIPTSQKQNTRSWPPINPDHKNGEYTIHPWQASDTLWNIAIKYWNDGSYYPVLLETNKGLNIYNNRVGFNIKILANIEAVDDILGLIVNTKDHRRYMRYLVQPQDNWAFIAMRFYGHSPNKRWLDAKSEPLVPGKRITIALKE